MMMMMMMMMMMTTTITTIIIIIIIRVSTMFSGWHERDLLSVFRVTFTVEIMLFHLNVVVLCYAAASGLW